MTTGLFCEHSLQGTLHHTPQAPVTVHCPRCDWKQSGPVRQVYEAYKDHVLDAHFDALEDCGCCGGYHYPEFHGDCREDWERF